METMPYGAAQRLKIMSNHEINLLNKGKLLLLADGTLVNNGATLEELSGKVSPTFVYFISDGNLIKIGKSDNPEKRLYTMQTGNGRKLKLLKSIFCNTQNKVLLLKRDFILNLKSIEHKVSGLIYQKKKC